LTVDSQGFLPAFDVQHHLLSTSLKLDAHILDWPARFFGPQQQRAPFDSWLPALMASDGLSRDQLMPPAKKALIHLMLHVLTYDTTMST